MRNNDRLARSWLVTYWVKGQGSQTHGRQATRASPRVKELVTLHVVPVPGGCRSLCQQNGHQDERTQAQQPQGLHHSPHPPQPRLARNRPTQLLKSSNPPASAAVSNLKPHSLHFPALAPHIRHSPSPPASMREVKSECAARHSSFTPALRPPRPLQPMVGPGLLGTRPGFSRLQHQCR